MSASLLEQAMSADILDQSWRRLKSEHTPWSATVTREELERHLVQHLVILRDAVLNETYRPQPLRQFPMKKPDGSKRIITAQYLSDKMIQRALLIVLESRAEALFDDNSYAYRPKRGVAQALNKVAEHSRCGRGWLVDADIEKFFDNIAHRLLIKKLTPFINDTKAMKLISEWLKQGAHQKSLLGRRLGIAQGAILSPLMCNLFLDSFDKSLNRANIPFVRFADDFLLFTDSEKNAHAAQEYARKQLDKLALTLHPKKTQVVKSSPKVIFLGQKLNWAAR